MKFTPIGRASTQARPARTVSQGKPGNLAPVLTRNPSVPSALRKNQPTPKQNQTPTANSNKQTFQNSDISTPKASLKPTIAKTPTYAAARARQQSQTTPKFNATAPQKLTGRQPAKPTLILKEQRAINNESGSFHKAGNTDSSRTPKVRINPNDKLMGATSPTAGSSTDRVRNAPEFKQKQTFKKPVLILKDNEKETPNVHVRTPSDASRKISFNQSNVKRDRAPQVRPISPTKRQNMSQSTSVRQLGNQKPSEIRSSAQISAKSPSNSKSPINRLASKRPTTQLSTSVSAPKLKVIKRQNPSKSFISPRTKDKSPTYTQKFLNKTTLVSPPFSPKPQPVKNTLRLKSPASEATLNKQEFVSPRVKRPTNAKLRTQASVPSMPALRKFVLPSKAEIDKKIQEEKLRLLEVQKLCNAMVIDFIEQIDFPDLMLIQELDSPIEEQPEALERSEIAIQVEDESPILVENESPTLNESLNAEAQVMSFDASTQSEAALPSSRLVSADMTSNASWGAPYSWENDIIPPLAFSPQLMQMLQVQQNYMNMVSERNNLQQSQRTATFTDRSQYTSTSEKHDMETQYSEQLEAMQRNSSQYSPRAQDFHELRMDTSCIETGTQIDDSSELPEMSASVIISPSEIGDREIEKKFNQTMTNPIGRMDISPMNRTIDISPMNRTFSVQNIVRLQNPIRKQFSKVDLRRNTTDFKELKMQAINREKQRKIRHQAAIRIQSAFKSYMVRLEIYRIKHANADLLLRSQLAQIGKRLTASFAPWKILNALRR